MSSRFATFIDVLADVQVEANGFMPKHPTHPTARLVASPVQFGGEPVTFYREAPGLGQHTVEVLSDAEFSDAEIDELLQSGAAIQAGS